MKYFLILSTKLINVVVCKFNKCFGSHEILFGILM